MWENAGPVTHRGVEWPRAHGAILWVAFMRAGRRSDYVEMAQAQGVERPFRILTRMPEGSRLMIGRLLGCHVRAGDLAELQAWRLINQNLRGLQARTHHLHEQLTPFSPNNTWWHIVTRTASRCGLRFYPGLKDEEVERLLFDYLASEYVKRFVRSAEDLDQMLWELDPNLGRAIASLELSPDGTRVLLASLMRAAAPGDDPREGANRLADWLRYAIPRSWTTSISLGLRVLQQRLGNIYEGWVRMGLVPWAHRNYGKVSTALAVIYVHDLVDRTREQFEFVGS